MSFPIFLQFVPLINMEAVNFFKVVLTDILKTRRSQGSTNYDFVDAINSMISKDETDEEFRRLKVIFNGIKPFQVIYTLFSNLDNGCNSHGTSNCIPRHRS